MDGLPADIPMLTAEDFCVGVYMSDDRSRCDLIGWAEQFFNRDGRTPGLFDRAVRAIYDEVKSLGFSDCSYRRAGWPTHDDVPGDTVTEFNDTQQLHTLAAVWNNALHRLGYAVPMKAVTDVCYTRVRGPKIIGTTTRVAVLRSGMR